jgi:hypothetical protein
MRIKQDLVETAQGLCYLFTEHTGAVLFYFLMVAVVAMFVAKIVSYCS